MNALKNWTKVETTGEIEYYTENESGRFYCDENGVLTYLESAEKNRLHQGPFGYGHFSEANNMQKLIIPEGIRVIGKSEGNLRILVDGGLRELIIVEKIVLPRTLEKLEANVLSGCLIMEMELPVSLREIGPGALMCNYIHVLRIPQGMLHPKYADWGQNKAEGALTIHGRQFKETIINTLIVPKGYPYEKLMPETEINHVVFAEE